VDNVKNNKGKKYIISWNLENMPGLDDKIIVITGANSGTGFECTRIFARAGAYVIMACRSAERAGNAIEVIRSEIPQAKVEFLELDLASLESIRSFAGKIDRRLKRIDILCNNAGVVSMDKEIRRTSDGFEAHFGINHLGHFALTGLLFNKIRESESARIVTVSSRGRDESSPGIDFDDLQQTINYSNIRAYLNSKLANLLFTYELDKRVRAGNLRIKAIASTPGLTKSNLSKAGENLQPLKLPPLAGLFSLLFLQATEKGALSEVYASVGDDINGCDYIGRGGPMARFGKLRKLKLSSHATDPEAAKKLWMISEEMTGVRFLD
jgi:NAD(P)-dependent dehydrogenase (short-subunit alcohol dehydrogenase family)